MVSHPFLGEVKCSDESSFSEGGGPPAESKGGGIPVCNRHQEEGRGDCDESPFPRRGWGDRDKLSFSGGGGPPRTHGEGLRRWVGINPTLVGRLLFKEGWGTVMSHSKGACPKEGEGGSINHSQGEGVGGQIMLMCPQSVNLTPAVMHQDFN